MRALLCLLLLAGCPGVDSDTDVDPDTEVDSDTDVDTDTEPGPAVVLAALGGVVVSDDGYFSMGIPAGALSADTAVSVVAHDGEVPEIFERAAGYARVYEVLPAGVTLSEPAWVTLRADTGEIISGARPWLWGVAQASAPGTEMELSSWNVASEGQSGPRYYGSTRVFGVMALVPAVEVGSEMNCGSLAVGESCWDAGFWRRSLVGEAIDASVYRIRSAGAADVGVGSDGYLHMSWFTSYPDGSIDWNLDYDCVSAGTGTIYVEIAGYPETAPDTTAYEQAVWEPVALAPTVQCVAP